MSNRQGGDVGPAFVGQPPREEIRTLSSGVSLGPGYKLVGPKAQGIISGCVPMSFKFLKNYFLKHIWI